MDKTKKDNKWFSVWFRILIAFPLVIIIYFVFMFVVVPILDIVIDMFK